MYDMLVYYSSKAPLVALILVLKHALQILSSVND